MDAAAEAGGDSSGNAGGGLRFESRDGLGRRKRRAQVEWLAPVARRRGSSRSRILQTAETLLLIPASGDGAAFFQHWSVLQNEAKLQSAVFRAEILGVCYSEN